MAHKPKPRRGRPKSLYQAVGKKIAGPADPRFADSELEKEWHELFGRLIEVMVRRAG